MKVNAVRPDFAYQLVWKADSGIHPLHNQVYIRRIKLNPNKTMEIKREVTITLTPKEVEEMIIEKLKAQGINVKSVNFSVDGFYDDDDWRGAYPPTYRLDKIICKGHDENIKSD